MPSKKTTRTHLNLSAEDFIRMWQSCVTVDEVVAAVAKKTGVKTTNQNMRQRARGYRMKGVALKDMPRASGGPHQDWKALSELAKSLKK